MTPREIIAEAWAITRKERALWRWGFTSSLFETLLSVKLLSYQLYFGYEYFFAGGEAGFFDIELKLYELLPVWLFLFIIVFFTILIVVEWFFPHLALGAIIGLAAKAHRKEEVKGGLVLALYNFFPIFAIHELLFLSSFSTTVTAISLILRYIEGPFKTTSIVILLILFTFSIILRFMFSFAEEGVVIRKVGLLEAIGRSFKLIVSHLGHIMFLFILLVVISLRILLNAAMMLILPGVILGLGLLLTLFLSPLLSYSIAIIVGMGLIVAASYFFAYLHVFRQTVWTLTYLELSQKKDLDVILE